MSDQADRVKLRIRFTKLGKIRWTSHRDVARMWERAFRRVKLPLAYSEGFSPRPKVSFGLALPTGCESLAEYLDVELSEIGDTDVAKLPAALSEALPVGVEAVAISVVQPGTPSLQEDVLSCSWQWVTAASSNLLATGTPAAMSEHEMQTRVESLLSADSVTVTRSRKGALVTEDIRAGILTLNLIGPAGSDPTHGMWMEAELACQPRSVRPPEVVTAIGPDLEERLVRRTHQWILRDGARREPLELVGTDDATGAPHALERVS